MFDPRKYFPFRYFARYFGPSGAAEGVAGKTQDLSWQVRAVAGVDQSVSWRLGVEHVGVDATVTYSVRNTVGVGATVAWNVEGVPVPVALPISPLFGDWRPRVLIPEPVGKTFTLAWAVGRSVAVDADVSWQVRSTVGTDATIAWQVRAVAEKPVIIPWQVHSRAGVEMPAAWRVGALAAREAEIAWQQRGVVAVARSVAYEVRPFDPFERNLRLLLTEIDEDAEIVLESWRKAA